jgi:putative ABC transport system substrate-binding protein
MRQTDEADAAAGGYDASGTWGGRRMLGLRRREFISLLGGAVAAAPLRAHAQQVERVRRIGVLMSGAEHDPEMQARLGGFREGLARFGWWEGRNVRAEYRFATASADRAAAAAKELVGLQPDVLVALATASVTALKQQTSTIPIVFVGVPDPIGAGFVTSLPRPGGNLTGTLLYEESIIGKWLSMLKEIQPRLARVAIVGNPKTNVRIYTQAAEAIAPSLAIELEHFAIETAADIEHVIQSVGRAPNGGLVVPPDLTAVLHRDLVIRLAAQHRVPAVYQARFWVLAGGLMSYGTDRVVGFRQAAYYVDRILHGEKPADLPVQGPTKFETILNLKTAKTLGLTVPPGLLVAADEVIE